MGFAQALKWVGGSGVWGFLCGRPPPVPRRGQGMGALAVGPAALSIENAAAQSPRRLPPSAPRRGGKEKKKQHFCCVGDSVIYRHGDAGHGRPLRRPPRAREGAAARAAGARKRADGARNRRQLLERGAGRDTESCTESPASEPPAPRVQGHENDGDRSDNDGSDNDSSASAASNAIPQDMMSALMQGV